MPLLSVKPSHVKAWTAKLRGEGRADSYVYALHRRLSHVMADAVHDGIIPRNPCSHRTSPGQGGQRPYVATTGQVWALHDAFPEHLRAAVLLGAFVGLRTAEAAALRARDVDFMRGIVSPVIQYPDQPLKSETSRTPVPIPRELALELSAAVAQGRGARSSRMRLDGSRRRGLSSAPCGRPGGRCRVCPRTSASTICGTTTPRS
ncbi:hypothetical protein BH24GEM2_BH24GEM2_12500 [soil metagenome]